MPLAILARTGEEWDLGYDLALMSLRDAVCVSSIRGSLYSCIQGVFVSFTILARAGEELYVVRSFSSCGRETGFLYLGRMTVLILRMSIAFSFKLLCSVNLGHRRLWTIFSYMGMGKLFVFESKSLFLACRAV